MEHQVQDRVDISLVVAVVVTMTIHQTLVVLVALAAVVLAVVVEHNQDLLAGAVALVVEEV
tara:strand:+ start:613 stop:795 length:183 start_codon:yes stop_codon:yes gene_type:complete